MSMSIRSSRTATSIATLAVSCLALLAVATPSAEARLVEPTWPTSTAALQAPTAGPHSRGPSAAAISAANGTSAGQIDAVPRLREQLNGRAGAVAVTAAPSGFDVDDAAIGAAGALGLLALMAAAGIATRRHRRSDGHVPAAG